MTIRGNILKGIIVIALILTVLYAAVKIADKTRIRIVTIEGDSMEPALSSGDCVKIKKVNPFGLRQLTVGRIVVFETPDFYMLENGEFARSNKHIPRDRRFHSFLINSHGEIIFIGNPIQTDKLWEVFNTTLNNL